MPAMVDRAPADGGAPVALFESGAILRISRRKDRTVFPTDLHARARTLQWLFWQVGGLGPMAGQNHHFTKYAPAKIPYAIERYVRRPAGSTASWTSQLAKTHYLAGEYSIADIGCYPWIVPHEDQGQDLHDFPHLKRWFEAIRSRPAVIRAYEAGAPYERTRLDFTALEREILFGQTSERGGAK